MNACSDDVALEVLDRLEPTGSMFMSLKEQHSIQASLEIVPTMHVVQSRTRMAALTSWPQLQLIGSQEARSPESVHTGLTWISTSTFA